MKNDCPAAHSMDTEWFAVDERGNVAVFSTGETGALPVDALADQEGKIGPTLAAQAVLARWKQVKWRKKPHDDAFDVALVAGKGKLAVSGLREVAKGALTLYAPKDELDDEALDALLADPALHGYLLRDDLGREAGFATYSNDWDGAPGEYVRMSKPAKQGALPKELAKKVRRLTLPVDFAKEPRLELWRWVPEKDVSLYESGLAYDGGAGKALAEAKALRRFELEEGGSAKFWEVRVEGPQLHVRWGRLGTDGQSQVKKLKSPDAAVAEAEALVRSKLKKGYLPATGAGATAEKAKPAGGWQPSTLAPAAFADRFGVLPPSRLRILTRETGDLSEAALDFGTGTAGFTAMEQFTGKWELHTWQGAPVGLPEPLSLARLELPGVEGQNLLLGGRPGPKGSVRFAATLMSSRAWLRLAVLSGKQSVGLQKQTDFALKELQKQRQAKVEQGELEKLEAASQRGDVAALKAAPKERVTAFAEQLVWNAALPQGRVQWKVIDFLLTLARKAVVDDLSRLLETDDLEQAKQALKRGADPKRSKVLAHELKDAKVFKLLLEHGMPIDRRHEGATVLHSQKDPDITALVVKAGADPDEKSFGKTPLAEAVGFLDETTVGRVKALLAAGADPSAKYDGKPLKQHLLEHVAGRSQNQKQAARIAAQVSALLDAAQR